MIDSQSASLWSDGQRLVVDKRKNGVYLPQTGNAVVRAENRNVVLFIEGKRLEMTTPVAVKVGLALVRNGGGILEPGDVIVLEISGIEVLLLPETAIKIGGAILRKADRADDWQRQNTNRSFRRTS